MGEGKKNKKDVVFEFNSAIKLEFCGAKITSNAGLLLHRELDETFNFTADLANELADFRTGDNISHKLLPLLRQSIYSRLGGYEDVNDADLLKTDPAMRYIVGGKAEDNFAASSSELGRFETSCLTQQNNLAVLKAISGSWIQKVNCKRNFKKRIKQIIFDIDSSESEVYGKQEGSAYNGHFECNCYHPLFCFNQFGDLEQSMLREGNVHSAHDWQKIIYPIFDRYKNMKNKLPIYLRADAAFGNPEFYEYLENNNAQYVVRFKSNPRLESFIKHLLTRPVGRPSYKPKIIYHDFYYQANSWNKPRRVIAKIEWHWDQLFPRVNYVITNLNWSAKKAVKFYNKRGTAEQWIKEGKNAIRWTKLSCRRFTANEVRLQLFGLAYNLGNFLRTLALPKTIANWTLTTLREKLIKLGAKVIKHARYIRFQMAEFIVTGTTIKKILNNIKRLRLCPG